MELDLETFLITLYVWVDDLYRQHVLPQMPQAGGPQPHLSDAEVLCLGLAAQWRQGVPWQSERGLVRYAHQHLRYLFPGLTSQSAFNRRLRRLWGGFILIQQALAQALDPEVTAEILDCVPVPMVQPQRLGQPGWLADVARIGKDKVGYLCGFHLLASVTPQGVLTGWTLGAANGEERWLAELLFSARLGQPQLVPPLAAPKHRRPRPPKDWLGPVQSCGPAHASPFLTDLGFFGDNWHQHWQDAYGVHVFLPPDAQQQAQRAWFSSLRQSVETAFAALTACFGLKFPGAHTTWGLLTRVAAKLAAYNMGIQLNRSLGRPDFAFATLIV